MTRADLNYEFSIQQNHQILSNDLIRDDQMGASVKWGSFQMTIFSCSVHFNPLNAFHFDHNRNYKRPFELAEKVHSNNRQKIDQFRAK